MRRANARDFQAVSRHHTDIDARDGIWHFVFLTLDRGKDVKQIPWILTLLFATSTPLLAYKFLWQGEAVPASDGRKAILLTPGERDLVLAEMRGFLQSVQEIVTAVQQQKVEAAAVAARRVGAAAQKGVPARLIGKLPGEFKMLGFDTHRQFDQLALDAEQLGDPDHTLEQLAALMGSCVGCHTAFRIDPVTEP